MLLLSHGYYSYYCYCYCDEEDLEQGGVVAMMLVMLTMMKSCDCSCWMRMFGAEVG